MTAFQRFDLSLIPAKAACASCESCASSESFATCATCATDLPDSTKRKTAITRWLDAHPAASTPGKCAWCSEAETAGATVVPFGGGGHGHTWLHPRCWRPWFTERQEQAARALNTDAILPKH